MLNTLLCKLNLGHHWLTEAGQNENFRRRCTKCGKLDRRTPTWSGHLAEGDRHPHQDSRKYF